jgi:hypothetical protein
LSGDATKAATLAKAGNTKSPLVSFSALSRAALR